MKRNDATGSKTNINPPLPILENAPKKKVLPKHPWIGTSLRVLVVLFIAAGLRFNQQKYQWTHNQSQTEQVSLELLQQYRPKAQSIKLINKNGLQAFYDQDQTLLGYTARTLPHTRKIVGYRGPTDLLLIFDQKLNLQLVKLIESFDTPEHVDAIEQSQWFYQQFNDWQWGKTESFVQVDGVSGATLTSLAMTESITFRLSGSKPALRFPKATSKKDLSLLKEMGLEIDAERIVIEEEKDGRSLVYSRGKNTKGSILGSLLRTGTLVDSLSGYQGPSELVLWLDTEQKVKFIALRSTFDNEPYAERLNWDSYFWEVFQNKTLAEIAEIDLVAEEVEGVSGATMTSIAVAKTIVSAAQESLNRENQRKTKRVFRFHWNIHDLGTVFVVVIAMIISGTKLRGWKTVRILWFFVLIGYFGFVTGNLLSQVVLMGWAASGVAWRLAPGLFAVLIVGFLFPIVTKRNVYCSHLCPHGAAQQLLKGRLGKRFSISSGWLKKLKALPGALLVSAVVATCFWPMLSLAGWEPFHAYLWPITGWASLILAIFSLVISCLIPMAYCRFGCPTGRLLDYVRHSAGANRLQWADGVALMLLILLWGRLWLH